ncbi:MAG: AmpG family muropeptide MFS transporter, partial [Gammaproteobacteria bacterium]
MADYKPAASGWSDAISLYTHPRVLGMVFLGFSAGLPFLLVFSTLSAWLRDVGVALSTIGFFSWIGVTYSIKVFWAPVIDRLQIPLVTRRMGKRRSWMLLAQLCIGSGLAAMAFTDPLLQLELIAVFALFVAFGSATQDISIDAYRIEAMAEQHQGAMAATYVFGYRVALLVAGAGAFYLAEYQSWSFAYMVMAMLTLVGISTTLIINEPEHRPDRTAQQLEQQLEKFIGVQSRTSVEQRLSAWFVDAVISPFIEFFQRSGKMALLILLLIGCYRISDITMGVMANPFYLDLGFSKTDIA